MREAKPGSRFHTGYSDPADAAPPAVYYYGHRHKHTPPAHSHSRGLTMPLRYLARSRLKSPHELMEVSERRQVGDAEAMVNQGTRMAGQDDHQL